MISVVGAVNVETRLAASPRRGKPRLYRYSFSIAAKILLDRFLHDYPERHMLRFRQGAAVFIFGRIVRDAPIHVRDLDAHRTPGRIHCFPASGGGHSLFLAAPPAQSG